MDVVGAMAAYSARGACVSFALLEGTSYTVNYTNYIYELYICAFVG